MLSGSICLFLRKYLSDTQGWMTIVYLLAVLPSKNGIAWIANSAQNSEKLHKFFSSRKTLLRNKSALCLHPLNHIEQYYWKNLFLHKTNSFYFSASSRTSLKWHRYYFFPVNGWQWRIPWLLVQFSAIGLICVKAAAILPIVTFVSLVQMSSQWQRQVISYYYENSFDFRDPPEKSL